MKLYINCSKNFALSCVNKVTTGKWSFVFVIANVGTWFATVSATKKHF